MSKGLDALKILYPLKTNEPYYTRNERRYACSIIEKELKEGQLAIDIVNRLYDIIGGENDIDIILDKVEKQKKALEIIKPYLDKIIGMNVYDKDFYECFLQIRNKRVLISKEEYDLLKEVLL